MIMPLIARVIIVLSINYHPLVVIMPVMMRMMVMTIMTTTVMQMIVIAMIVMFACEVLLQLVVIVFVIESGRRGCECGALQVGRRLCV